MAPEEMSALRGPCAYSPFSNGLSPRNFGRQALFFCSLFCQEIEAHDHAADDGLESTLLSSDPLHGFFGGHNGLHDEFIAIFKIKAYSRMNGTNLHSPVELQPEMHAESHLEEHPMSLL